MILEHFLYLLFLLLIYGCEISCMFCLGRPTLPIACLTDIFQITSSTTPYK